MDDEWLEPLLRFSAETKIKIFSEKMREIKKLHQELNNKQIERDIIESSNDTKIFKHKNANLQKYAEEYQVYIVKEILKFVMDKAHFVSQKFLENNPTKYANLIRTANKLFQPLDIMSFVMQVLNVCKTNSKKLLSLEDIQEENPQKVFSSLFVALNEELKQIVTFDSCDLIFGFLNNNSLFLPLFFAIVYRLTKHHPFTKDFFNDKKSFLSFVPSGYGTAKNYSLLKSKILNLIIH